MLPEYITAVRANFNTIAQNPAAFARGTGCHQPSAPLAKQGYNINMVTLWRLIERHGLLSCVAPPRAFCSNDAFESDAELRKAWSEGAEKNGHYIPMLAELLADPRAFTVHLHVADKSYSKETLRWVWRQITNEVKKIIPKTKYLEK